MVDAQKVTALKVAIGDMMNAKTIIREEGEPIWVSDVLVSLRALEKEEEAQTLEALMDKGLARPGTRFDELAILIRKLLAVHNTPLKC